MEKRKPEEKIIAFIRLNTGEDLISEIQETEDTQFSCLVSPFKILYKVSEETPGMIYMELMHWIFPNVISNQYFDINQNNILLCEIPDKSIIKRYHQQIEDYNTFVANKANTQGIDISNPSEMENEDIFYDSNIEGVESINQFLSEVSNPSDKKKLH